MKRTCVQCGGHKAMTGFKDETLVVTHAGMTAKTEGLSGWHCIACGEVEFDPVSAQRYAAAGDALVLRERERQRARTSDASAASWALPRSPPRA